MAFFRKKPKELDATFPQLTLQQGEKMRSICAETLTGVGHAIELADDHVTLSDGRMFGLETIARTLPKAPEREWKDMIEDYFARMTAKTARSILDDMPTDELLTKTVATIIDPAKITEEEGERHYKYTRWVGLLPLVMAYDGEETVNYLRDDHVERVGEDQAWETAFANLLAEGTGTPQQATDADGASFLGIMSESIFQSSWLAYPAALLDALELTAGPKGILMTVPSASAMNLHIINDDTSVKDLFFMTQVTRAQYDDMPHALSPHLYWWNGGPVQPITEVVDGELAMMLPDELEYLLSK
ncbi:hypothetical protein AL755_21395 [Arthrobacter sp. ERGS1:01]|uniref:hypothetical protein n=1 Tax=Arthrobacter sp. ERGS1:01 TaxID=1704044 RepID=UPI0006B56456|nr:hypothetical protein [Arthrobacter sp. ERGS1:01]ALE07440.1 hypothetical protein AL755_21395 [Arthrobacter sp. ERGS1:01]